MNIVVYFSNTGNFQNSWFHTTNQLYEGMRNLAPLNEILSCREQIIPVDFKTSKPLCSEYLEIFFDEMLSLRIMVGQTFKERLNRLISFRWQILQDRIFFVLKSEGDDDIILNYPLTGITSLDCSVIDSVATVSYKEIAEQKRFGQKI